MNQEQAVKVIYEIVASFLKSMGDYSDIEDWDNLSSEQKKFLFDEFTFNLSNPNVDPKDVHDFIVNEKKLKGWKLGKNKDKNKKEDPFLMPYDQLDTQQRSRYHILKQGAKSLSNFIN